MASLADSCICTTEGLGEEFCLLISRSFGGQLRRWSVTEALYALELIDLFCGVGNFPRTHLLGLMPKKKSGKKLPLRLKGASRGWKRR